MAVYEQQTSVRFVPTIASTAIPPTTATTAEITAGTDLTPYVTKDGVQPPTNQNMVDTGSIDTNFDSQEPGSFGGPFVLILKKKRGTAEVAWTTISYGLTGYLVVSYDNFGGDNVPVAGDKIQIFPVKAHEPLMNNSAANEEQKFTTNFAVTSKPNLKGTVS